MSGQLFSFFDNIVMVKVTGKNVNRFLAVIYKNKIKVFAVNLINRNEVDIKLSVNDLELLNNIKTTHHIEVKAYYGKLKIKGLFKKNRFILSSLVVGYLFLLFLANIIFSVEVIHDNKEIRNIVIAELEKHNIKRLQFKPNYQQVEAIEEHILKEHKDKIEWLEIIEMGTKYIVRVEERKIIITEEEHIYQDIIATKEAIIVKIEAEKGTILKKQNDYVKKGEVVISGKIMKGEEITDIIKAQGKIWGEVWYNVKVELPMIRREEKQTGKVKYSYNFKILNYKLPFINFRPFKHKKVEEKNIINHQLLPIKITKEKQYEVNIIEHIYNDSEALVEAANMATKKMADRLKEDETILNKRILNYYQQDGIIYVDVFFKISEDITGNKAISLIGSE